MLPAPFCEYHCSELWAVVGAQGLGLAIHLDQPLEHTDHSEARDASANLDGWRLTSAPDLFAVWSIQAEP